MVITILASELKKQLTPELIEKILEEIGCHQIKHYSNKITAARPTGDNPSSVCCWINNENLHTDIFTKGDYQSQPIRDLISCVGYICGLNFPQSMKKICNICNLDYYYQEPERPKLLSFLDMVEGRDTPEREDKIRVLPETILDQFIQLPSGLWASQGINVKSQRFFNIGFDVFSERITIPIYNELGDLCGVKGRTISDDENKYLYIYPAPKSQLLYGEFQNTEQIKHLKEVVVVESEKSVIKLHSIGFPNALAIGGKSLSEKQCQNLLRMNVPITLALDEDVNDTELNEIIQKLQYPVPTVPVYIVRDKYHNYLGEKESPMDNAETWKELYNNFKERVV